MKIISDNEYLAMSPEDVHQLVLTHEPWETIKRPEDIRYSHSGQLEEWLWVPRSPSRSDFASEDEYKLADTRWQLEVIEADLLHKGATDTNTPLLVEVDALKGSLVKGNVASVAWSMASFMGRYQRFILRTANKFLCGQKNLNRGPEEKRKLTDKWCRRIHEERRQPRCTSNKDAIINAIRRHDDEFLQDYPKVSWDLEDLEIDPGTQDKATNNWGKLYRSWKKEMNI